MLGINRVAAVMAAVVLALAAGAYFEAVVCAADPAPVEADDAAKKEDAKAPAKKNAKDAPKDAPKKDAKEAPAKKQPAKAAKAAKAPENLPFGDDIDKIHSVCELTDAQKERLQQAKAQRDKELEKFNNEVAPKLEKAQDRVAAMAAAKAPKADEAKKQLEAFKAQIAAERQEIVQNHARKLFMVLTVDQRAKWNDPLLNDELMREFSIIIMDSKQIDRLTAFCSQQARVLTMPVDPTNPNDKQLNPVKMMAYRSILTGAQQAEYRKLMAPAGKGKGKK